jgi:transposase-like protein
LYWAQDAASVITLLVCWSAWPKIAEVAARLDVSQHNLYAWIKRYSKTPEARQDVFDCIEMFYNPKRRHSHANDLSPAQYEKQYFLMRLGSV